MGAAVRRDAGCRRISATAIFAVDRPRSAMGFFTFAWWVCSSCLRLRKSTRPRGAGLSSSPVGAGCFQFVPLWMREYPMLPWQQIFDVSAHATFQGLIVVVFGFSPHGNNYA